ncbi:MAG: carboxymuconolactone decarboxylase family protein [Hydrogenophaga sp.]|uniref:carboxymuconolactone decarboxylase family protein n=1 Tax=unclassified Hydrogenophaga TaxID=2610897 RepID=UPI00257EC351|nr:carboxymuconolactone decarboxylase family protein [Hydrogenophaga sp.]MBL0946244.1 carboxymuconolactone decarboxylase family protein [Hydrogenophaga sp.]
MARVKNILPDELPSDLRSIYTQYARDYGPFANQVAVIAHVPAALRHLMPMLMELRAAATLPKRYLELAIVTVSKLNACHYCVGHHKPFLIVEGLSADGVDRLPAFADHPELDEVDKLVVAYAVEAWERPQRVPERLFVALRAVFSEAQIVELTLRITLCGFFNRFSEALQIDEEVAHELTA